MWYVIQVLSGQEQKAADLITRTVAQAQAEAGDGLQAANGRQPANDNAASTIATTPVLRECFVPKYQVERKFHGEYRMLERNLFPGYVIAVTSHVSELNQLLRGVHAFTRILGNEKSFVPLDRAEMQFIDSFTSEKQRVIRLSKAVAEGDAVTVVEGPMKGHEAWIKKINRRKGTAHVEMSMFGRTVSVEIGLAVVTKA